MTDEQFKNLAKLVTYLLETQDWRTIWLNEFAEPIRLFMYKTGISYHRVMRYINFAMNKLLGEEYILTQRKLALKCCGHDDLLFKPKPQYKKLKEQRLPNNTNKGRTIKPRTEFGKKYVEHFGYGSSKNISQYNVERKFFQHFGRCRWETEK